LALKVGELYGVLRLDNSQFDRGLDQSGKRFSSLRQAVGNGVKTLATAFAGATVAVGGLGAAAVKVGLDYNRLQQSSRAALATLLGGAEAANAQMDKLDEFARTSPFAKQVFITAQQQLLGFGVQADKVLPTLDAIQNAVAAMGGSNQQVADLAYIFAQISAAGEITATDLMQFGQRGVDAATLIGSQMGLTGAEIREKITAGSLDAQEALDALAAGMMDRFGGATDNIKQQFDGAADRIKGAWRDIGSVLAAPFIDPNGGGRAVEWANLFADGLRNLEAKARPLVDLLAARFAPQLDAVSEMLRRGGDLINTWDLSKVNDQLDELSKYGPLIAGVSTALFTLGAGNLPILSRLGITLNPVVAGVAALVAASPDLRAAAGHMLSAFQPLVPIAADLGVQFADLLTKVIDLAPEFADILIQAAPLAVTLGGALADGMSKVLGAADGLLPVLSQVAGVVANLSPGLLTAVGAFLLMNGPVKTLATSLSGPLSKGLLVARTSFQAAVLQADGMGLALTRANIASIAAKSGIAGVGTALKVAFLTNPVGLAITAVATAIGVFAQNAAEAKARADSYAEAVKLVGDEAQQAAAKQAALNMSETWGWFQRLRTGADSAGEALRNLGLDLEEAARVVSGSDADFDAYIAQLESMRGESLAVNRTVDETITWLHQQRNAFGDAAEKNEIYNEALGGTEDSAGGASDAISGLNDELRTNQQLTQEAADATLSLKEAQLRAEEQQDRTSDALERYNDLVDAGEASQSELDAALRDVEQQLLSQVRSYHNVTEAMGRNNASAHALDATIRTQREAFINTATSMGYTREEAEDLADAYGLIPNNVVTEVQVTGIQSAQDAINRFILDNNGRRISLQVTTGGNVSYGYAGSGTRTGPQRWEATGDVLEYFANGGIKGMSPMSSKIARIVPANTLRVIGDRAHGDEAFIPLVPGARNLALWAEAGRRLGALPVQRNEVGGLNVSAPAARHPATQERGGVTVADLNYLADRIARVMRASTQAARVGVAAALDYEMRVGGV